MRNHEHDNDKYLLPLKMQLFTPFVIFEKSYTYLIFAGLISVLFLFCIKQGFSNITSTDISICVLILLVSISAYIIIASSSYLIIDEEKFQHKCRIFTLV